MYFGEDDYYSSTDEGWTKRHQLKLTTPKDIHLPNKNEGKLLRKLMSETGLTEKELREHKKYRIMLSEEQKRGQKFDFNSRNKRIAKKFLKGITRKLKLPKEHPLVIKEYLEQIRIKNLFYMYGTSNEYLLSLVK